MQIPYVKASLIKPLRGLICNFALLPTAAILLCKTAKLHSCMETRLAVTEGLLGTKECATKP